MSQTLIESSHSNAGRSPIVSPRFHPSRDPADRERKQIVISLTVYQLTFIRPLFSRRLFSELLEALLDAFLLPPSILLFLPAALVLRFCFLSSDLFPFDSVCPLSCPALLLKSRRADTASHSSHEYLRSSCRGSSVPEATQ
jgi:hypothetical protein